MTTSPRYSSFGNPRPIAVNHRRRRHCRPEVELTDLRIHNSSRLPVSFVGAARTRRGILSTSQRQSMAAVASSTSTEALRRRASLLPVAGCHLPLFAVRTPLSTSRAVPCSSSSAARQPWRDDEAGGAQLPSRCWRCEMKLEVSSSHPCLEVEDKANMESPRVSEYRERSNGDK